MKFNFSRIKLLLSENRTVSQTLLKNTFWLSFSEIGGRLLRAIVIIYAARMLGAEGFGTFSYALGLAGLLTIFSDLGIGTVLTREGAKDSSLRGRYFSTAIVINVFLALFSSLIIILITPLVTKITIPQILLLAIALVFVLDSFRGLGSSLFRAMERMEREALANIISQLLFIIAGFILITKLRTPESLAFTYVIGSAGAFLITLYLVRGYIRGFLSRFDRGLVKSMLAASLPISIASILGGVMINTDTVLLGWLTDAKQVGLFAAAQKPIFLLYLIPSFIAGGLFPTLARLTTQDRTKSSLLISKGMAAVMLFALPMTVGLFLTSNELVRLLYGLEYLPAVLAFQILGFTLLTMFPMSVLTNAVFAYNQQKFLMRISLIGIGANLALDLVFIPIWGIAGCALATFLTQIFVTAAIWTKMKRINNFTVLDALKKIAISTLLIIPLIIILAWNQVPTLLIILLAGLVYLGLLYLLKEPLLKDLKSILVS